MWFTPHPLLALFLAIIWFVCYLVKMPPNGMPRQRRQAISMSNYGVLMVVGLVVLFFVGILVYGIVH